MPQQINLFHPVLLAPKHHFPALAMVQALGLWSLALVALAGFSLWRSSALQAEMAGAETRFTVERTQLGQALAAQQATTGDPAALKQELAQVQARLAERQRLLDDLGGSGGGTPTKLLQELAQSLPQPVWLTSIGWAPGQLALSGQTVDIEALRQWLERLGPTATLRVERREGSTAVWAFRLGQAAAAATTPDGATR
jgi:Tfp pilus assembly protein PilN